MSNTSSADFRTLPLSEMETIISRFDERVNAAMRKDVIFHRCGNVMRLIPELIDLGVDVLDAVQPMALNVDEVGRQFGGQISFCGGIDVQRLEDFTPQQMKDAVRHSIDALGKPYGNAYVLTPANVITPSVPFENIEAMFQACHEQ